MMSIIFDIVVIAVFLYAEYYFYSEFQKFKTEVNTKLAEIEKTQKEIHTLQKEFDEFDVRDEYEIPDEFLQ